MRSGLKNQLEYFHTKLNMICKLEIMILKLNRKMKIELNFFFTLTYQENITNQIITKREKMQQLFGHV